MKISFSLHALKRMNERFITKSIVISRLEDPDALKQSSEDEMKFLTEKIYFNPKLGKKHLLLIIYREEKESIKIITVIDTSKIKKYFS